MALKAAEKPMPTVAGRQWAQRGVRARPATPRRCSASTRGRGGRRGHFGVFVSELGRRLNKARWTHVEDVSRANRAEPPKTPGSYEAEEGPIVDPWTSETFQQFAIVAVMGGFILLAVVFGPPSETKF